MKIGTVIPAYNVGDRLHDVLLKVVRYIPPKRIYVVDDGSVDSTANVAEQFGVVISQHGMNKGKGEALKTGFQLALEDHLDGIITLDGDGQHDPDSIPEFIQTMETSSCDVVLGVRSFRIGRMPLDRICSNLISSIVVSLTVGKWIPDSQCGYRLIRSSVLRNIYLFSSFYEIETELLIKAVRNGCKISTMPISLIYNDSNSHIKRFVDTKHFCKMILRLIKDRNENTNC